MKARSLRTTAVAVATLAASAALAPVASAEPAVGITGSPQRVVNFDTAAPAAATSTRITGLAPGELLRGIDRRPANGVVYGFGSQGRIYTLDPATGVATPQVFAEALGNAGYGVDFNPVVDRLRVVTDSDLNRRIDVSTGATIADGPLAYAANDRNAGRDPKVNASAYTNNFAGAGATVLYGLDTAADTLVTQAPPNTGTLNTIGTLGVNARNANGFDISPTSGIPFAALRNGETTRLYRIDLGTGAATLLGEIGDGTLALTGLTIITQQQS